MNLPNRSMDNPSSDYSGGNVISSEEELEAYLKGATPVEEGGEEGQGKEDEGDKGKEPPKGKEKENPPANKLGEEGGTEKEGEGKEDGEEEGTEYKSIVHYLDSKYKLGLNVDGLPEDISAKQEAELVEAVFQRVIDGTNRKLAQYKDIDNALKDPEVAGFIKAKLDGKTMKDFVTEYAATPQGLPSDAIAAKYIKTMNPSLTEEEVKDMVNLYREKGKLDKLETDARKHFQDAEVREARLKEEKATKELEQLKAEREQDMLNYRKYLSNVKDISGVPVDDKMKRDAFLAATQVVDTQTGETWLDRALLDDKNVFRAIMGILYMERLVGAKQTTEVNKRNKALADSLFDTPDKLQSGSSGTQKDEFNPAIANQW